MLSDYECVAHGRDAFTGDIEYAGDEPMPHHEYLNDGYVYLGDAQAIALTRNGEYRYLVEVDVGSIDQPSLVWVEAGFADRLGMGATWNEILMGENIWQLDKVMPDGSRRFIDPSTGKKWDEELYTTQTMRVLLCVDDQGNYLTTDTWNIKICDLNGYTPPTGSCWASVT
jgi:hypothetical protein